LRSAIDRPTWGEKQLEERIARPPVEAKFAEVPEPLWQRIEPLIPAERAKPRGGRPRVAARVVMAGISLVLDSPSFSSPAV
jgi:hypothetical protein